MKKAFFLLFTFAYVFANANTFIIQVTNNQFNPATITNVIVGDVVSYHFMAGFHNAVSSGIASGTPAGAAAINSGSPSGTNPRTYDYTVTTAGQYKYVCEVHGDAASFTGMTGTFTASNSLPVKLSDFKIINQNNKAVLVWKTASEQNTDYFSIQRSTNGSDFKELTRVNAAGNSNEEKVYKYIDNADSKSKFNYYMLAIVDKDGRKEYSKTVLYKNSLVAPKLITSLSPNPITKPGHLMIKFNAEKAGRLMVRVLNMEGKSVIETDMSAYEGANNGHVHLGDLPAGTYTIVFTLGALKESRRVIVK